ncbi:hypothetical protein K6U59_15930, partial [Vibrio vulnificus]|uniref:hypothetical protein n=1 Tax=Vibrio vulnificus TaxID=672 RepID=UPI001EEBC7B8
LNLYPPPTLSPIIRLDVPSNVRRVLLINRRKPHLAPYAPNPNLSPRSVVYLMFLDVPIINIATIGLVDALKILIHS